MSVSFKDCYNSILFIVYHNLFNHSLFIICLPCLQSFGTINNAVLNILVYTFICTSHFCRRNSVVCWMKGWWTLTLSWLCHQFVFHTLLWSFPPHCVQATTKQTNPLSFNTDSIFSGESLYRILEIRYSFITNEIVLSTPFGFGYL